MTSKNDADTKKKESIQQNSLKGALTGVLAKEPPLAPAAPLVAPVPQTPEPERVKKPFEVPEQALRDVLGGG